MKEYEDGESMCKQIITSICTALLGQNKTNKYIYFFYNIILEINFLFFVRTHVNFMMVNYISIFNEFKILHVITIIKNYSPFYIFSK